MSEVTEVLPMRGCAACGTVDDHPRVQLVLPGNQEADLFHYDCAPHLHRYLDEPGVAAVKATKDGKRGDDVRAAFHKSNDKMLAAEAAEKEGA